MRALKIVAVVALCVFGMTILAGAGQNQFGVADSYNLTFKTPMRVGDVLLPKGDYQVLHTMEGQDHIMVFKQLHTQKPAEARVKCHLKPLEKKAERTSQSYELNASNEKVLRALVFRGDLAEHVF